MSSTSTSQAYQGTCSIDLALEVAVNHLAHHDLIDDHFTKLTCRQVCREWRALFSDTITSVTLHSLDNVDQLNQYFPPTLCVRSPWQSLEESRVFANLKTVKIGSPLGSDLRTFVKLDSCGTACRQFEIAVEVLTFHDIAAHLLMYSSIGTVSALTVGKDIYDPMDFDTWNDPLILAFDAFDSIVNLTKLTHLTLLGVDISANSESLAKLRSLTMLGSLRNLEVGMYFYEITELVNALKALAAVTQVTSLYLTTGMLDTKACVRAGSLVEALQLHSPQSLKQCMLRALFCVVNGVNLFGFCGVFLENAEFICGKLRNCHMLLNMPGKSSQLRFSLDSSFIGREKKRLDITWYDPKTGSDVSFSSRALKDFKELELIISSQTPIECPLALGPLFWTDNDALVSTTYLSFKSACRKLDYTGILETLPLVLPNLQELQLDNNHRCPNLSVLSQLTALTCLSLGSGCSELNLSDLPPLLKDLKVTASLLEASPAPPLLHLTRLSFTLSQHSVNKLSVFRQSAAPLRDLTLESEEPLEVIPALFPRLEKLKVKSCAEDISSLLGLQLLRDLEIEWPQSRASELSQLTQLWKLKAVLT